MSKDIHLQQHHQIVPRNTSDDNTANDDSTNTQNQSTKMTTTTKTTSTTNTTMNQQQEEVEKRINEGGGDGNDTGQTEELSLQLQAGNYQQANVSHAAVSITELSPGPHQHNHSASSVGTPLSSSSAGSMSSDDSNSVGTEGDSSSKKKRKRFNEACTECRRAHKACSRTRPCERCVRLGIPEKCQSMERKKRKVTKKRWFNYQVQEDGKIAVDNQVQATMPQIKDETPKRKSASSMTFVNQFPSQQPSQHQHQRQMSPQHQQMMQQQQHFQQQQQQVVPQQRIQQQHYVQTNPPMSHQMTQQSMMQFQQMQSHHQSRQTYQFDPLEQQYRMTFVNHSPQYQQAQTQFIRTPQQQPQAQPQIQTNSPRPNMMATSQVSQLQSPTQQNFNFINMSPTHANPMNSTTATIDSKQSEMIQSRTPVTTGITPDLNSQHALPSFNQLTRTQQQTTTQQATSVPVTQRPDPTTTMQHQQQSQQQQYLPYVFQQQQQTPGNPQQQWISDNSAAIQEGDLLQRIQARTASHQQPHQLSFATGGVRLSASGGGLLGGSTSEPPHYYTTNDFDFDNRSLSDGTGDEITWSSSNNNRHN